MRRALHHCLHQISRRCCHDYAPPLTPIVYSPSGAKWVHERQFDIYAALFRDRKLCIFEPITDETCQRVIGQLHLLQLYPNQLQYPVNIYINSPGGSLDAGLMLYDYMQYVLPPIATWCVGRANNVAALLLSAGDEGMRHSLPHASIKPHIPPGNQDEATDVLKDNIDLITEIYQKHTHLSKDAIEKLLRREVFLDPTEAKACGLVDYIVTQPEQVSQPMYKTRMDCYLNLNKAERIRRDTIRNKIAKKKTTFMGL